MDRYNIKTHSKTSEINDDYWKTSLFRSAKLINALKNDNDQLLITILEDVYTFTGSA